MSFPDWILAHGEALQISLFFSLLLILAIVEPVFPRRPGPSDRKMRWTANLFLTFVNFVTLSVLPVSLIGAAFWAQEGGVELLNAVRLTLAALVAANLLVRVPSPPRSATWPWQGGQGPLGRRPPCGASSWWPVKRIGVPPVRRP